VLIVPALRMPPAAPDVHKRKPNARESVVVVGERLALHNYYVVTAVDAQWIHCQDHLGNNVKIGRPIVEQSMSSTTQYHTSVRATRTQMAQRLEGVGHAAFRVTFTKQVTHTTVADGLDTQDLGTQAKRRKVVKDLMVGENRVMHARLWRSSDDDVEMELGRYRVVDLEASKPGKIEMRMVDTRTISELVVEGVRYHI
jgi:hypothetical protein